MRNNWIQQGSSDKCRLKVLHQSTGSLQPQPVPLALRAPWGEQRGWGTQSWTATPGMPGSRQGGSRDSARAAWQHSSWRKLSCQPHVLPWPRQQPFKYCPKAALKELCKGTKRLHPEWDLSLLQVSTAAVKNQKWYCAPGSPRTTPGKNPRCKTVTMFVCSPFITHSHLTGF